MSEARVIISEPARTIRILVVDDHLLLSETLATALETGADATVDMVADVDTANERISEGSRYDVVLLDYDVPGMDALNGLKRLLAANDGGVALFTGVANWMVVDRAIEAGASGFIPKTLPFKILRHAIRLIADGATFLPTEYMRRAQSDRDAGLGLKPRELQVLGFLCEGLQNKEIGNLLDVPETIVKLDVKSICRKLGARNRTQAVIEAGKRGLC